MAAVSADAPLGGQTAPAVHVRCLSANLPLVKQGAYLLIHVCKRYALLLLQLLRWLAGSGVVMPCAPLLQGGQGAQLARHHTRLH